MSEPDLIEQLKSEIARIEGGNAGAGMKAGRRRRGNTVVNRALQAEESSGSDALSKIIALVNVSERSEHAIRERLTHSGFEQQEIDEAVDRAKEYRLIDDMRFASVLIRSRISQGKGTQGIVRELASHDIDINDVPGWPYDFDESEESEFDRALSFLQKRPPKSKNLRDAAYRKLISKGFSSSTAASAARSWSENAS